jgi:hypothetical protein
VNLLLRLLRSPASARRQRQMQPRVSTIIEGLPMPEGMAAYLLDCDVDRLRTVYAERGVQALMPDADTILEAYRSLTFLKNAVDAELKAQKAAEAHHAA